MNTQSSMPALSTGDWRILCDFDGTVVPFDVTDALLGEFAAPEWEDVEQEWKEGRITARRCMEQQIALLAVSRTRLDAFLDEIPLTKGFHEFASLCQSHTLDLRIVSDGLAYPIRRILARHGLNGIPVISNTLVFKADKSYGIEFPYGRKACPSGVCKCSVAARAEGKALLIGDGRSDCCLAGKADFVLAKEGLHLHGVCATQALPHLTYTDFHDVCGLVARMLRYAEAAKCARTLAA